MQRNRNIISTLEGTTQYLIVDFDDTLVLTSQANSLSYIKALEEFAGIDLMPMYDSKQRLTIDVLSSILLRWNEATLTELKQRKERLYIDYLYLTVVSESVLQLIREHPNKIPILLSNANRQRLLSTLAYHRLQDYFDCIEVNPHPKENKYSYLLNKYQLNPMQCYVLEDDEHQLALATLAGIPESNQTKITNYD